MKKIIKIENLSYAYQKDKIFNNLSLSIDEASFTAIVGNNASGKTTLIKLIAGLLPSNNSIIAEYAYVNAKKTYLTTEFFGICLDSMINNFLSSDVYSELAFPLENLNMKEEKIEKRILEVARLFKNTKMLDKKIEDLTIVEKKELVIMVALLHKPKVLLLDNMLSMLTKESRKKVLHILKKLQKEEKMTIIMATTNLKDIVDSDYTIVLNNGKIVMEGPTNSIFNEDAILNKVGLELPFMENLSKKLQFYEVINKVYQDMDNLVNDLWK